MRRNRLVKWIIAAVVVVVILVVGGPFVYIHFIEGPAPGKLSLPKTHGTGSGSAADLSGTWSVSTGSQAGYRVQEVLIGQNSTAVGRTSAVSGQMVLDGTVVKDASFSVKMADVKSDQSERNAQFDGRIMDVAQFPTATFTLTSPITLPGIPDQGHLVHVTATGNLTLRGQTRTITMPISAERSGSSVYVLADATIVFSDFGISNPSIGGFVTTANQGTMEVLVHLERGAQTSTTTPESTTPTGPPSQVTVPSTTVPPLTVPTSG